ncbi:MAG TPA: hypothetical protein VMY41_06535 [Thermohalobaculum sp.]|nr:hypothetical protein [Thermohalobaculum sp.]
MANPAPIDFIPYRKTFKREVAISMLLAVFGMAIFAMTGSDPDLVSARAGIVTALAIPVFGFAALAYGMQWITNQTDWGGPPVAQGGVEPASSDGVG